ncbi:hypothetical protein DCS_03571 [Drechmeria coniospora]|uniref:Uncharacterized protein n=1 Tax=Drechmeria coniospora TaxID=98403 RepID=A0A151GHP9_DRECN|nr:hypothetical protein DCS_03571 [Drechmeria coniospora]KYK56571.1 hypothetical protein DCS_03571 [Drechmeria coniospora]ODA77157.1 hypothetical protein RJ55_07676 [Drechmeria coniospora]
MDTILALASSGLASIVDKLDAAIVGNLLNEAKAASSATSDAVPAAPVFPISAPSLDSATTKYVVEDDNSSNAALPGSPSTN